MAILKCKMCGGTLEFSNDESVAVCEYCGSKQTVPLADDEKKIGLFSRANKLRTACNFDKAAGVYENIINDYPEEAEAYWGLILCNYGIEYVDDPATGKKIPTCHRSSFDSIMDSSDFEMVMENADPAARKVYRDEAKAIEEIRKSIVEVSSKEEPYDIFICYKETDEFGDRTLDSVIAQDVYNELSEKGYRVFFSRITLEDKLGVEYEPYIFAALNSAKIMLVFGTDYEFFNAVWVKNEWSRYLKLMANDKSKHLIPCYKGVDVYDMPKEFARLQAQDMGKVGAVQDLLRGIEKLLSPKTQAVVEAAPIQQTSSNPSVDSYLKRAFIFLEDGDWKSADEYCEKVLDIDPENAQAYLGKLMAELHAKNQEALNNLNEAFDGRNNFQKIRRYGDTSLVEMLDAYNANIKRRIADENHRKEKEKQAQLENERLRIQKKYKNVRAVKGFISTKFRHSAAVKSDGTVVAVGYNEFGQCNVKNWSYITAVVTGDYHTVAIKTNGTVVAAGNNSHNQCNTDDWTNVIAVAAGERHTVALKSDGTVVTVGDNTFGQCSVNDWNNIVAIAAGESHTVGLMADGTVVATGDNINTQCDVSGWSNVVAVSAGYSHTVALKSDGTVVATGNGYSGQCNVGEWRDICEISAGGCHTVGLKIDGTVVAVGENEDKQCNVNGWNDIVAISAGNFHTIGLIADGTVVAVGYNNYNQCNIAGALLFENIENIAEERNRKMPEAHAAVQQNMNLQMSRRNAGLCQHCGGQFKGLFVQKCTVCGEVKDY